MTKVAFIGSYDKADMIIYLAKALTIAGKKVIVVDSTVLQKTRYIVPTIQPLKKYITTYEGVDIAIGFESFEDISLYKQQNGENYEYDYALVDVDSTRNYVAFKIAPTDKHYFVTSMDIYNIRRGLQIFKILPAETEVTKVIYSREMLVQEDQYINYLSSGLKLKWTSDYVFFPFEIGDQSRIFEIQRSGRITTKGLSSTYRDSLEYLLQGFATDLKGSAIRKAINELDK
jgi:hypothetical protein